MPFWRLKTSVSITHPGVDTLGVLRAAYSNMVSGGKAQGASTITMQVARNFFLTREKTLTRKLYEVLLAFKIEANLSKERNPPALLQPDLPRPARLRFLLGCPDLFRQDTQPADCGRSSHAGWLAQGTFSLQPGRQSEAGPVAPVLCAAPHA